MMVEISTALGESLYSDSGALSMILEHEAIDCTLEENVDGHCSCVTYCPRSQKLNEHH